MFDSKKFVEDFAAIQHSGRFACPRCGRMTMDSNPVRNDLSRRATIYVCDGCGMQEAMEDMADSRTPLEEWAICKNPAAWGIGPVSKTSDHIRVDGHCGTWYVIDDGIYEITPDDQNAIRKHLFLLEHEEYGDEAACVIVDENRTLVIEDVWNGFDDLLEAGWKEIDNE